MKEWQYVAAVALGIVAVVMSVLVVAAERSTQRWQIKVQEQQAELQRLASIQQFGQGFVRQIGSAATTNAVMRALLERHGITLAPVQAPSASAAPPAAPGGASAAKPAAPKPATTRKGGAR